MPIPLFSIPAHIRDSIIQKMSLPEFVNFHQSSRNALETAMNLRIRFVIDGHENTDITSFSRNEPVTILLNFENEVIGVNISRKYETMHSFHKSPFQKNFCDFPVRFGGGRLWIDGNLCENLCNGLINFLISTNSNVDVVFIEKMSCSPEALCRLVHTGKVKKLKFSRPIAPEYMKIEAINDATTLSLVKRMTEQQIFQLDAHNFHVHKSNLSSSGLNFILKELLGCRRRIIECSMRSYQKMNKDTVFEGIPISKRYRSLYGVTVDIGRFDYAVGINNYGIVTIRKIPLHTRRTIHMNKLRRFKKELKRRGVAKLK